MSVDIRGAIEYKEGEKWVPFDATSMRTAIQAVIYAEYPKNWIGLERDDCMFSILEGTEIYNLKGIEAFHGVPKDADLWTFEVMDRGDYGHTAMTLKQILSYDWCSITDLANEFWERIIPTMLRIAHDKGLTYDDVRFLVSFSS